MAITFMDPSVQQNWGGGGIDSLAAGVVSGTEVKRYGCFPASLQLFLVVAECVVIEEE